jgi:nucleoside-diphosphate kinase
MSRGWLAGSLVQQLLPLLQCGQRYTAKDIEQQETLLLLKPNIAKDTVITENIRKIVTESGLDIRISNVKVLSDTRAASFYRDHIGKPYFDDLLSYISSGPTYVMILTGLDAIKVIRKIVGPTDPVIARHEAPDSLRALYGVDLTMNSVHASDSLASAAHEIQIICSI